MIIEKAFMSKPFAKRNTREQWVDSDCKINSVPAWHTTRVKGARHSLYDAPFLLAYMHVELFKLLAPRLITGHALAPALSSCSGFLHLLPSLPTIVSTSLAPISSAALISCRCNKKKNRTSYLKDDASYLKVPLLNFLPHAICLFFLLLFIYFYLYVIYFWYITNAININYASKNIIQIEMSLFYWIGKEVIAFFSSKLYIYLTISLSIMSEI